jgi:transposase
LYCQDESRFGLFTRNGKALTAKGVKPICPFQQKFQSLYVFGAFSPITGEYFVLELPHCNSQTFQIYLDELSLQKPQELKILLLDNGAFHKAKKLAIPDNIALVFIPPYSPELNPAEKVWWTWKRNFSNKVFQTLDDISEFIKQKTLDCTVTAIKQLCGYDYLLSSNIWTIL